MRSRLIAAIAVLGLLAGCGGKLNPKNWFGRSKQEQMQTKPKDPHQLVARIVSLRVDRTPGGAIIRAVGLPERQGYFEATLKPLNDEKPVKGVLTYEFRLLPPEGPTDIGPSHSREVLVGRFVSKQTLQGVRVIKVVGQNNRRSVRR
ncbi:MAG: hypothetical protein Q9M41_08175 [Paracoccaceae bacterium]|nr:hypothetical protein [Paracoccaceae bacterium]